MTNHPPICLLHLSDFHVGKDDHGHKVLFRHLLDHIRERVAANTGPDLVMITGDIAQSGVSGQCESIKTGFLAPLGKLIPAVPI